MAIWKLRCERESHLRRRQAKCGHRANEAVRHRLIQALTESPPPSCAEIVRRVAGHKTVIREDFPDLWRELPLRYRHYKQELRLSQRQAFAADVRRAVMELHCEGVYPTRRLVLAKFPAPQFRSWHIVAGAIRLARCELSIGPFSTSRGQSIVESTMQDLFPANRCFRNGQTMVQVTDIFMSYLSTQ